MKNFNLVQFKKALATIKKTKELHQGFTFVLGENNDLVPARNGFVIATGATTPRAIFNRMTSVNCPYTVTVGGWVDSTGKLLIESGVLVHDYAIAMYLANTFGQVAIWDVKKSKEHRTDSKFWSFNGQNFESDKALNSNGFATPSVIDSELLPFKTLVNRLQDQIRAARTIIFTVSGYKAVDDALEFYLLAGSWLRGVALDYSLPTELVAAVAAALSPNNKWPVNQSDTVRLIDGYKRGQDLDLIKVSTYGPNKDKAIAILNTGETHFLSGPKVVPFSQNLNGDFEVVTVDTWCLRHAFLLPFNAPVTRYTKYIGEVQQAMTIAAFRACLLYTSPSPRDRQKSRMPSSA